MNLFFVFMFKFISFFSWILICHLFCYHLFTCIWYWYFIFLHSCGVCMSIHLFISFVFPKWTYILSYSEELLDGNLKITLEKQKKRNEITCIHIYFSFSFISFFFFYWIWETKDIGVFSKWRYIFYLFWAKWTVNNKKYHWKIVS